MGRKHRIYPELVVSNPARFMAHLESLIRKSTEWHLAVNQSSLPAVVAAYTGGNFDGSDLSAVVYPSDALVDNPPTSVLVVAMLAEHWGGDAPCRIVSDYDLNTAFNLFRPLVRAAAERLGCPCRIKYAHRTRIPPRPLTAGVANLLDSFCIAANVSCLHPYDWQRYYTLIGYCHAHRVKLSEGRMRVELERRGIPAKMAQSLAEKYAFGRSLLKESDDWGGMD